MSNHILMVEFPNAEEARSAGELLIKSIPDLTKFSITGTGNRGDANK